MWQLGRPVGRGQQVASDQPANREPVLPGKLANITPVVRSFDEMNTGQMVFELQGTVGELREAVSNLSKELGSNQKRLEAAETTASDIKDILKTLIPKIDDIVGFTKHAAPNFANKADIATLNAEIQKRPTRWQSIVNFGVIVGLILALLTIGSKLAH